MPEYQLVRTDVFRKLEGKELLIGRVYPKDRGFIITYTPEGLCNSEDGLVLLDVANRMFVPGYDSSAEFEHEGYDHKGAEI